LDHQNNYVGDSGMMSNTAENFNILAINLRVLHNYFDLKLFLAKVLDTRYL